MKIAFIGYGELGVQIHELLKQQHSAIEPVYFDDVQYKAKAENAYSFKDYVKEEFKNYSFVICLGYKHALIKNEIFTQLDKLGRRHLSFVHPSCFVNSSSVIEAGTVLYPMCNIDKGARIGNSVLLNNSVVISHDSTIGDCCYLSPGVVLSGKVTIGRNTFLGTGSVVANGIKIGNNVVVGIGTVVTKDIPDGSFVIGNPMRSVEHLEIC
jgi:sugar O-acyltransferase (sialic acid O-acetyltransferase NeuD family)